MLKPADPNETIPLSKEQESYLTLGRDGHGAVPLCYRVRGKLDIPALQQALAEVAARHEPLRMRLLDTPEGLRQVFRPAEAEDWLVQEIIAADSLAAQDMACELAAVPSDLRAQGPVRTWLIRSGPADMLLVVLIDHLSIDGWSSGIFSKELWTRYYAASTGTESAPLPPAARFTDFVVTQRDCASSWTPAQYQYWRQVSQDYCEPVLQPRISAPVGSPEQPGRSDLVCAVSHEQLGRLTGFARAAVVPPRTVELAGLLLALWAWCPAPVINVWCMHSGRENRAIAHAIGNYSRSFPLAVRIDPEATLADFTRNVLHGWSEAVGYSGTPYSAVAVRELIARAGGADPAMPEVRLNQIISPPGMSASSDPVVLGKSTTVEWCDLTATRWSWYREPRVRIMSILDTSLTMRAIFNPGVTPPEFVEATMTYLDRLLPLFATEYADEPIGKLVDRSLRR
ncbi:MAG: condensation domain-containing protein [Streptosporangiaceae bacterium]